MRIGVISDTHGLLRPEALAALRGCDRIIHAGDVGDPAILATLQKLAPVTAVRGNIDIEPWAKALPVTATLEVDGSKIFVLHNCNDLKGGRFEMVVSGHSHQPVCETVNGVLYLNPGSAGPRRFRLPVTLALVDTDADPWHIEFVTLTAK